MVFVKLIHLVNSLSEILIGWLAFATGENIVDERATRAFASVVFYSCGDTDKYKDGKSVFVFRERDKPTNIRVIIYRCLLR